MGLSVFKKRWKSIIKFFESETKKHVFLRYGLIALVLLMYFFYAQNKFGTGDGLLVTFLTWSFFVFCTPIADAGFLIDLPVRLITKLRMVYSEMIVWSVATILNVSVILTDPTLYDKTILLKLFYKILVNPYPFWGIIILSAIGTFFSITFGDELMDVARHKDRSKYKKHSNKHKLIIFIFIIVMTIVLYNFLLNSFGIKFPLF